MKCLWFEWKYTGIRIVSREAILLLTEAQESHSLAQTQLSPGPFIQSASVLSHNAFHLRKSIQCKVGPRRVHLLNAELETQSEFFRWLRCFCHHLCVLLGKTITHVRHRFWCRRFINLLEPLCHSTSTGSWIPR